jgi:hypothetical protein
VGEGAPSATRVTIALFVDRLLQIGGNAALGQLRRNDATYTRRCDRSETCVGLGLHAERSR